jgi:hypothetical protein
VRSLARLETVTDGLGMRMVTLRDIASAKREAIADNGRDGRVLAVGDRAASHERNVGVLAQGQSVEIKAEALFRAANGNHDTVVRLARPAERAFARAQTQRSQSWRSLDPTIMRAWSAGSKFA